MPRRPVTDPTAVVARRGGAWFINAVLCALAGAIPALLLADAYELNRTSDGFDVERHGDDIAFFLRDTVVVLSRAELAVTAGAFAVGVLLVLVLLPAWKGWSPGHLAADLRIVRRDGRRVGVGGAIVRTLGWIVDILPGIPLVAYTSARVTRHHQRVGDRLARTYVVDKRAAGRPVDQPLTDDVPESMTVEEPEQESVLVAPREPEPDLEDRARTRARARTRCPSRCLSPNRSPSRRWCPNPTPCRRRSWLPRPRASPWTNPSGTAVTGATCCGTPRPGGG